MRKSGCDGEAVGRRHRERGEVVARRHRERDIYNRFLTCFLYWRFSISAVFVAVANITQSLVTCPGLLRDGRSTLVLSAKIDKSFRRRFKPHDEPNRECLSDSQKLDSTISVESFTYR